MCGFSSISFLMFIHMFLFSRGILLVPKTPKHPVLLINTRGLISGKFNRHCRPLLATPQLRYYANPYRGYAMVVARILRGALKLRYLLIGGTVGGGVTLQKVYTIRNYCKLYFFFIYTFLSVMNLLSY